MMALFSPMNNGQAALFGDCMRVCGKLAALAFCVVFPDIASAKRAG
jgi:hypothetical protein